VAGITSWEAHTHTTKPPSGLWKVEPDSLPVVWLIADLIPASVRTRRRIGLVLSTMSGKENRPPHIEVEVDTSSEGATRAATAKPSGGPPVHPLAAAVLLTVDNLWNLADWSAAAWVVTIPASFVTVFVPALLLQRYLKEDPPGRALRLALLLGALAAVPTSIFGTPVGLTLLAWSGLNRLFGSQGARGGQGKRGR
jgi:hypothetical protein